MSQDRFARQNLAIPPETRRATALAVLNARSCPWTARLLAAGAACMGAPRIFFDWSGPRAPGGHWLAGAPFLDMVRAVDPGLEAGLVDRLAAGEDLKLLLPPAASNAWAAVLLNDRPAAMAALDGLRALDLRVLLVLASAAGVVVADCASPRAAAGLLKSGAAPGAAEHAAGPPRELALLAAGIALNSVVCGDLAEGTDAPGARIAGFYSLHRPARVIRDPSPGSLDELCAEVSRPLERRGTLRGSRIRMVGAGALGNWFALAVAGDSPGRLTVHDGDGIAPSNLNRQVLLSRHMDSGRSKAAALVDELRVMDPAGGYEAVEGFVTSADDLGGPEPGTLAVSLPDNDQTRLLTADAAWRGGSPHVTAGTSAFGCQAVITKARDLPGACCYRCVVGGRANGVGRGGRSSCSLAEEDQIVSSSMVAAGLAASEARVLLGGGAPCNLRFQGRGAAGNALGKMASPAACAHAAGHYDGDAGNA